MQARSNVDAQSQARKDHKSTALLTALGAVFVACFFLSFTWRGLLVYYTGDDMMNLYGYWTQPVSAIVKQNIFFWLPGYRPFGGAIYRILFGIFGFNPYPEYTLYFAVMLANLWLAYKLFARLAGSREVGAIGTLLWAFHGKFDYLYYNGGSLYDVYCFLFAASALLIYLRARARDRFLGLWGTIGFLACFICALNSKEMAVTMPAVLFLYELLFHPPDFRQIRAMVQWLFREGRMALISGVCVAIYLPAKLGTNGIGHSEQYIPSYTLSRWLQDTGTFLADVLYRTDTQKPLGIDPLTPLGIAIFFAALLGVAWWLRSRVALFGVLFFVIAALPVSFIPPRLGFVLYLPLAGLALFGAVCLVRFKDALMKLMGEALSENWGWSRASAIALFLATAGIMSAVNYRNWPIAPSPETSKFKNTAREIFGLYPKMPKRSQLLFVHDALDPTWDLLFELRNYYRDPDLYIAMLNGPKEQRVPVEKLGHFDHIFDYVNGHYVELDNTDTVASVKLHLLKTANPDYSFGETMTVGKPGVAQYIVNGVLVGDDKAKGFWTLDQAELQFRLATVQDHVFRERYFLPRETLQVTGPLVVDFYVNDHHLDKAQFAKDGIVVYEHAVPAEWLKSTELTRVKMVFHNPYVNPQNGVKLGVLLMSAGFSPIAL
ncbi:MAG TPA: hypothetical protein VFW44_06165 [Bryobacteraceae bacterium]|nr:hypothetical protein [Bryobacteraceae bacterium]